MAFDSYAAVCCPLHYMTLMQPHLCFFFCLFSFGAGIKPRASPMLGKRCTTELHPSPHLCFSLDIASWSGGLVNSLIQTGLIMAIPLYGNHLNHLWDACIPEVDLWGDRRNWDQDVCGLSHSCCCSRSTNSRLYAHISRAVLNFKSVAGHRMDFGTCGSHLLVVSLPYGSAMYPWLQPKGSYCESKGMFLPFFLQSLLCSILSFICLETRV
jgi:olfactory receptor